MSRPPRHPISTVARFLLAALVGAVVAVIVILNLHILVGLEEGYAAGPADVVAWSPLLAVADIALLVAGPVLGSSLRPGCDVAPMGRPAGRVERRASR